MKNIFNKYLAGLFLISAVACTSGGFNENPKLDELNAAMAFTPKVVSISVNGAVIAKNEQSMYQIDAKLDDVLNITAVFESGKDAELVELQYEMTYFGTEIEEFNGFFFEPGSPEDAASAYTFGPVDPGTNGTFEPEDAFFLLSGTSETFEGSYTVPEFDHFGPYYYVNPGDFISVHFRVKNSLDNYGYNALQIHVVE